MTTGSSKQGNLFDYGSVIIVLTWALKKNRKWCKNTIRVNGFLVFFSINNASKRRRFFFCDLAGSINGSRIQGVYGIVRT